MRAVLPTLLLILFSVQALASVGSKIPADKMERYMELSGIEEMIDAMPLQIDAMINQRLLTAKNPEIEKQTLQVLNDAWDSGQMKGAIIHHLQLYSNEKEISALLDWREEPLAKKITAAELESSLPEFQSNLMRYIADLQLAPPSPETMRAIQRLVQATDMVDMMVEMTVQVSKAMISSFTKSGLNSEDNKSVSAAVDEQIDSMRASIRPGMEQQAILMSYYIYRNISDEDLNNYAKFYESSLGTRELKLVSEALVVSMSLWAERSATGVIQNMEKKH